MSVQVPESIEHLDFESELEEEDKYRHYAHPTKRLRWCGSQSKKGRILPAGCHEVTCPDCLELAGKLGWVWWWKKHHEHYGTRCYDGHHSCGR